jgi:hypothetical protein
MVVLSVLVLFKYGVRDASDSTYLCRVSLADEAGPDPPHHGYFFFRSETRRRGIRLDSRIGQLVTGADAVKRRP